MAHDVFISHSASDKPYADGVCAKLESRGIRCWIAPRDIRPGMSWGRAIVEAIDGARVMLLVFSSRANRSPQVSREVERAVSKNLVVVPVRIEGVKPSGDLEYFLGTPHWLDAITSPFEQHLEGIADSIKFWIERLRNGASIIPNSPSQPLTSQQAAPESAPEPELKIKRHSVRLLPPLEITRTIPSSQRQTERPEIPRNSEPPGSEPQPSTPTVEHEDAQAPTMSNSRGPLDRSLASRTPTATLSSSASLVWKQWRLTVVASALMATVAIAGFFGARYYAAQQELARQQAVEQATAAESARKAAQQQAQEGAAQPAVGDEIRKRAAANQPLVEQAQKHTERKASQSSSLTLERFTLALSNFEGDALAPPQYVFKETDIAKTMVAFKSADIANTGYLKWTARFRNEGLSDDDKKLQVHILGPDGSLFATDEKSGRTANKEVDFSGMMLVASSTHPGEYKVLLFFLSGTQRWSGDFLVEGF